jgi:oxaloacetate decarboxylase alpha subunit
MVKEVTHRPADDIPAEYSRLEDEAKKLLGTSTVSPEDVLTLAMFPQVAPKFFKSRADGPVVFKPEADAPAAPAAAPAQAAVPAGASAAYNVNVNGANYAVVVSPAGTVAAMPVFAPPVAAAPIAAAPAAAAPAAPAPSGGTVVPAPVAGTILRYAVSEGAEVGPATTIIIIESMKMELELKAGASGKVHFLVPAGTQVASQQAVAQIS